MPELRNQQESGRQQESGLPNEETQPLVDGISKSQSQALCTFGVLSVVVVVYWVVDGWNREVAGQLFQTKVVDVDPSLRVNMSQGFANPLLLTALQFAFMTLIFFGLWTLHAGGQAVTEEAITKCPN
jgi:hypothetical protein